MVCILAEIENALKGLSLIDLKQYKRDGLDHVFIQCTLNEHIYCSKDLFHRLLLTVSINLQKLMQYMSWFFTGLKVESYVK